MVLMDTGPISHHSSVLNAMPRVETSTTYTFDRA